MASVFQSTSALKLSGSVFIASETAVVVFINVGTPLIDSERAHWILVYHVMMQQSSTAIYP